MPNFSTPVEFVKGETQASGSGDASESRKTEASPEPQKTEDIVEEGSFHSTQEGDNFDPAEHWILEEEHDRVSKTLTDKDDEEDNDHPEVGGIYGSS